MEGEEGSIKQPGVRVKRDRDSVSTEEPARKRAKRSTHEQRLFANYHIPREAKPLTFSYTGSDWSSRATAEEASGSARMGGFKPMNTLGVQKYGAKATGAGSRDTLRPARLNHATSQQSWKHSASKMQHQLSAQASKGSIEQPQDYRHAVGGDGFEESGRTKRRKIEQRDTNQPARPARNGPIDLTAEDSQGTVYPSIQEMQDIVEAEVVSVPDLPRPGARTHSGPPQSMKPPSLSAQQGQTTMQRAFEATKPSNKPRKPKDLSGSSQDSRAASVVSISGSEHSGKLGSAQKPVALDDDSHEGRGAGSKQAELRQKGDERPVIELDKDFSQVKTNRERFKHGGRTGTRDHGQLIDAHHSTAQSQQPGKGCVRPLSHVQAAKDKKDAFDNARTANSTLSELLSHHEPQKYEASQKLSKNFTRDDGGSHEDQPKKARLRESMKGDSSPDELQGRSTVGSRASRSVSPIKQTSNEARLSPSNIKHTKFTPSEKMKQRRSASPAGDDIVDVPTDVPIRAFYSHAACITTGDCQLRWNGSSKKLELWKDGFPVLVAGQKMEVTVGTSELTRYRGSTGSPRLILDGSKTEISHGKICIAAQDFRAAEVLVGYFCQATKDNIKHQWVPRERLDMMFDRICGEIQKAYKLNAGRNEAKVRFERLGELQQLEGGEEEEQIQYEVESEESAPVRDLRAGAKAGRANAVLSEKATQQPRTPSRFFDAPSGATRRSTRDRKLVIAHGRTPSPTRWTVENKPKPWSKPVEYPPQGLRRVTVDFSDLERLDEGSFLNDTVISFGMRKIEEEMDPEKRAQVHFFNSFFYTSLTIKNGKKTFNYEGVKKWTKNKDIFNLPYVVVPINIDLHWFVAIICNLDKIERKPPSLKDISEDEQGPISVGEGPKLRQTTLTPAAEAQDSSTHESIARLTTTEITKLSLTDDDGDDNTTGGNDSTEVFAFGPDGKIEDGPDGDAGEPNSPPSTATGRKSKRKSAPPLRKFDIDKPAVITLDSFGSTHSVEVRNLKDYVTNEAMEKRGIEVGRDALQGVNAKGIPQQTNSCDCGVYLLGYIEQFAKDPGAFVEKVLSRRLDEQSDFASFDPSAKRAEIRNQLLELNETQEAVRKQAKKARAAEKAAGAAKAGDLSGTTGRAEAAVVSMLPENVSEGEQPASGASSPSKRKALRPDEPNALVAASSPVRRPSDIQAPAKKPRARSSPPEQPRSKAMQQHVLGNAHDDDEEGLVYEAPRPHTAEGSSRPSFRGHSTVDGRDDEEMLDQAEDLSGGEDGEQPVPTPSHYRHNAAAERRGSSDERPEEIPDSQEVIAAVP